jgi:dTDP-4-amino-4,6-dideoxygalactose transaminase
MALRVLPRSGNIEASDVTDIIPFIDLQAQRKRLGASLEKAILAAVESGQWILGEPVGELEERLARFAGVKHAIACANGTDALLLVLKAWGVGPGDAVFVPAFTFAATAEVVALAGAIPVFVDVLPDSYNLDPASLETAIATIRRDTNLKPQVVIPVDLFGQPADYRRISPIVAATKLRLLCDSAQAFGATLDGRSTVSLGHAGTTSFFPAKPLGCYGDGGACFTDDDDLAEVLRSLRMHGQGRETYEHTRVGLNSRLDTIQAAILIEKLSIFADEIEAREKIARRFNSELERNENLAVPRMIGGVRSVWAQYTIRVNNRAKLQAGLKDLGVPSRVYYPAPLPHQTAYSKYPSAPIPEAIRLCSEVVSLPMHPYLSQSDQHRIVDAVVNSVA